MRLPTTTTHPYPSILFRCPFQKNPIRLLREETSTLLSKLKASEKSCEFGKAGLVCSAFLFSTKLRWRKTGLFSLPFLPLQTCEFSDRSLNEK